MIVAEPDASFLVVCEGSSDYALLDGIIQEAGNRRGQMWETKLLEPQMDATRGRYKPFGWTGINRWCVAERRILGSVLALSRSRGLFIHMDTDIAEQLQQGGEFYSPDSGITRRHWCERALTGWLGSSSQHPGIHFVLPTYQIETWLLSAWDDDPRLPGGDYETILEVEPLLLEYGFRADRDHDGKIYRERTLYSKVYLPRLIAQQARVRDRCAEFARFQDLLDHQVQSAPPPALTRPLPPGGAPRPGRDGGVGR